MRKESQKEIVKQGLVMDGRTRAKIGLRIGIFHVLENERARVMGS